MALSQDEKRERRKEHDDALQCFRPPPYLKEKLHKYAGSVTMSKNQILIDALKMYLQGKYIPD